MKRPRTGEQVWHVYGRGVRRLSLFYEDFDYLKFLGLLREACVASGCVLFAYCLMSNHYHLILRATSAQLSQCMWLLNRKYALHHNQRHKMGGHVFEGPYRAHRQRTLNSILWRIAYVFLNPVMAGLVGRPEQYRWSGYLSFMGLSGSPLPVSMPERYNGYHDDWGRVRAHFLLMMETQLRYGKRRTSGPTLLQANQDQFEALLRLAEERKDSWSGKDPRLVAMYWGHRCGIPPRAMAVTLGESDLNRIRKRIDRFSRQVERDPELARRVELP
jgi:REP element-mobilizing transposase RayT